MVSWQDVGIFFKKRRRSRTLWVSGAFSFLGVLSYILLLTGMSETHSGDIFCGSECVSYVNITSNYWRVCFSDEFDLVETDPEIDVDVFVPARGKNNWRLINFSKDCINRKSAKYFPLPNRFKIVGHKDPGVTVKWTFDPKTPFIKDDVDPLWIGNVSERTPTPISLKAIHKMPPTQQWIVEATEIDRYADIKRVRINATTWKFTVSFDEQLHGNLTECFTEFGVTRANCIRDVNKSVSFDGSGVGRADYNFNSEKLLSRILADGFSRYPVKEISKELSISKKTLDLSSNNASFTVSIPGGWQDGLRFSLGYGSANITGVTTDEIILSGSNSVSATLPAQVNMSASILFVTIRMDANRPDDGMVRCFLKDDDTVTCRTPTTIGTGIVRFYVAEFNSGVTVQRGPHEANWNNVADHTWNVSEVTLSDSFIVPGGFDQSSGGSYNDDEFIRVNFTNATHLAGELSTARASNTVALAWQVVTFAGANVKRGLIDMASAQAVVTINFTEVVTNQTFFIFSHETEGGTNSNIGQKMINGRFVNNTQIEFARDNTGSAITIAYEIIELPSGNFVQHAVANFSGSALQVNFSITAVNTTRALAFAPGSSVEPTSQGRTPYAGDDNPGVTSFTINISNSTHIQIDRAVTGSQPANVTWFVVEFNISEPSPAGDTVPAFTTVNNNGTINDSVANWTTTISDDVELSFCWFTENQTGTFVNLSVIECTTPFTWSANITVNAVVGANICGFFTANDSTNQHASTSNSCFDVTVTGANISFTGQTDADNAVVTRNHTFINLSIVNHTTIDTVGIEWNGTNITVWGDGLVGLWHLNNDTLDYSGNENDGLAIDGIECTTGTDGQFGTGCYASTSGESRITIGDPSVLEPLNLTISMWFKRNGSQISFAKILWKGSNAAVPFGSYGFEFVSAADDDVEFLLGFTDDDNDVITTGSGSIEDDTWYSLVGTFNGTLMEFYLNGVSQGTVNVAGSLVIKYDSVNLSFGSKTESGGNFRGKIDEVRIWDHALSAEEVSILWRSEIGRYYANITENSFTNYSYYGWVNQTTGQFTSTTVRNITFQQADDVAGGFMDFTLNGSVFINADQNQTVNISSTLTCEGGTCGIINFTGYRSAVGGSGSIDIPLNITIGGLPFYNTTLLNQSSSSLTEDQVYEYLVVLNFTGAPGIYNITLNATNGTEFNGTWMQLNITFPEVAADSCTYTSGTWAVDCSDNCFISSAVDLGNNELVLSNTGSFNVEADITNMAASQNLYHIPDQCLVTFKDGVTVSVQK